MLYYKQVLLKGNDKRLIYFNISNKSTIYLHIKSQDGASIELVFKEFQKNMEKVLNAIKSGFSESLNPRPQEEDGTSGVYFLENSDRKKVILFFL